MDLSQIPFLRLQNQQLLSRRNNIPELVNWMGAIQAQDYPMSKWAIGNRVPGISDQQVEKALDRGEILRTHILRPTWHLVSARDIYGMLQLSGPKIIASQKSRYKELELIDSIFTKGFTLLEKLLSGGKSLTREEIFQEWETAGIACHDQRGLHLLVHAELEGLICSGVCREKSQTYALLAERVPVKPPFDREAELVKLVRTYFRSHGPATLADFGWWSGVTMTEAKKGLQLLGNEFTSVKIESETYWLAPDITLQEQPEDFVLLLPAFDEYLISYKDRRAMLPVSVQRNAISINGIFWPIIVVNGQVTGLWKRTFKKEKVIIEPQFFQPPARKVIDLLNMEAQKYGAFLGKEVEVVRGI